MKLLLENWRKYLRGGPHLHETMGKYARGGEYSDFIVKNPDAGKEVFRKLLGAAGPRIWDEMMSYDPDLHLPMNFNQLMAVIAGQKPMVLIEQDGLTQFNFLTFPDPKCGVFKRLLGAVIFEFVPGTRDICQLKLGNLINSNLDKLGLKTGLIYEDGLLLGEKKNVDAVVKDFERLKQTPGYKSNTTDAQWHRTLGLNLGYDPETVEQWVAAWAKDHTPEIKQK